MLQINTPGYKPPPEPPVVSKVVTQAKAALKGQAFAVGIVVGFLLAQVGHLVP